MTARHDRQPILFDLSIASERFPIPADPEEYRRGAIENGHNHVSQMVDEGPVLPLRRVKTGRSGCF